jgi:hypothetical protein
VVLKVGLSTVLAFAEGRPGAIVPGRGCDDGTGRSVWMRRSTDGGRHWGKHRRIVNDTDPWHAALQDGVQMGAALYDNVTKTTFVFYTTCTHQCKMRNISASSLFITSKNDGVTWSEPTNITTMFTMEGMYMMAFGQGLGVQFPQTTTALGLLMICGWFDVFTTYSTHDPTKSGVVCVGSVDSGTSWRVRGTLVGPHAGSEVGLALLKNGSVLLDMRSSDGSRARIQSRTDDGGLVAPASLHHMIVMMSLPDPISNGGLTAMPDGRVVLSHDATRGPNRTNMSLFTSDDGGTSFDRGRVPCRILRRHATGDRRLGVLDERASTAYVEPNRAIVFASLYV